jgi:hypothetical protein
VVIGRECDPWWWNGRWLCFFSRGFRSDLTTAESKRSGIDADVPGAQVRDSQRARGVIWGLTGVKKGQKMEARSDDIVRFEILGTCDAIVALVGPGLCFRGKADVTALGQALGEPL